MIEIWFLTFRHWIWSEWMMDLSALILCLGGLSSYAFWLAFHFLIFFMFVWWKEHKVRGSFVVSAQFLHSRLCFVFNNSTSQRYTRACFIKSGKMKDLGHWNSCAAQQELKVHIFNFLGLFSWAPICCAIIAIIFLPFHKVAEQSVVIGKINLRKHKEI